MPYPRISKSRTGHHEFESGKRNAVLEILSSPNEVFQTSLGGEQLTMGAFGIRVENASDIAPALAQALAAKRPAVIDVATDIEALAPTAVT